MAYPAQELDWDGIVREVDRSFVRTLRQQLTALGLFAPFRVRDLGVDTVQWHELSDIPGAKITADIPAFSPDSGTTTKKTVDIPILTKDTYYSYKQYLRAREVGIDTVTSDEMAWGLAVEVNKLLLKGNTGGPGPATGLLNDSGQLTLDNSATTDWRKGDDMVKDLNQAISKLMDANFKGPFTLLMSPLDSDLMGGFITNTSVIVRERMPDLVQNVLFEKEVAQNNAYLIAVDAANFDVVTPFASPGATELWTHQDPLNKGQYFRWITALAARIKRPKCVVKIVFDRVA